MSWRPNNNGGNFNSNANNNSNLNPNSGVFVPYGWAPPAPQRQPPYSGYQPQANFYGGNIPQQGYVSPYYNAQQGQAPQQQGYQSYYPQEGRHQQGGYQPQGSRYYPREGYQGSTNSNFQQQQQQAFAPEPPTPVKEIKLASEEPKLLPTTAKTESKIIIPAKQGGGRTTLVLGGGKAIIKKSTSNAATPTSNISKDKGADKSPFFTEEDSAANVSSPASPADGEEYNSSPTSKTKATTSNVISYAERREQVSKELAAKRAAQGQPEYKRDARPHYSVVFCGHVDAGKSTISGHLMFDEGIVDEREMEKLKRDAAAKNRAGWEFAYVFDVSEEERTKGKTHETGSSYFETEKKRITVLDAPGHKAFIPSMIGGATQADIAVLVISARTGEFESGFEKGGQTREHALLVRVCGVKQMICVINKMDETTEGSAQWNEHRYDEIVRKIAPFLKSNGYDEKNGTLVFIPTSGLKGYNLTQPVPAEFCHWYDKGTTIIDYINNLELIDNRKVDDIVAVPLIGAYKDEGKLFVYGKCESGSFVAGDKLQILPGKTEVIVDAITIENTEFDKCFPGDNVHIRLRGIEENEVHKGFMLTSVPTTIRAPDYIQARIMILDVKNILSAGSTLVMHIHTAEQEVTIHKILATIDKKSGQVIENEPRFAKAGDTIMARLELESPVAVETHKDFDKLSRFMLREEGKTVALGLVTRIYESKKEEKKN